MVRFDQTPQVGDTILFEVETIINGKLENPSSVERIIVYCIQIKQGSQLKQSVQSETSTFYFNEAEPVVIIGNRDMPAWKPGADTIVKPVEKEEKPVAGLFQFQWQDEGLREGTYVLFWEWKAEGALLHAHKTFHINSNKQPITADPTRYTPENKYKMLMNLYTPSMYKNQLKTADMTPEVLSRFNASIAEGFTLLEDLANQLGDMLDANLAPKSILPLLANNFGLKLRTDESNRWRQQIKRAVRLYKRKGTLNGLYEALSQAGIRLVKLTKLWQVSSAYIQTDGFMIDDSSTLVIGKLSKLPISNKFDRIKLRSSDGSFVEIPQECLMISHSLETKDAPTLVWSGGTLKSPINLYADDLLLVTYKTQTIPENQRAVEDYIQTLPLADDRPDCATKNWNTRLIEDDDPLFDRVAPSRHPFAQPTIYGKIRTKFLYSEQVYNMDTYNGSLRDSYSPCDLDDTFFDQCTACQSSMFDVDLEIENLSEDRIQEAKEIIKEYSPFHARLHYINVAGAVNEFILTPQEEVQCLVQNVVSQPLTKIAQQEGVSYDIEWRDGTKEHNTIN